MLLYCLKCREKTDNKNSTVAKTNIGKLKILSKCTVCGSKISRFIGEQGASGLLSSLGINTTLSHILLVCPILFLRHEMN